MPTWDEILRNIGSTVNIFDSTRRKYIKDLSDYTGRNTIIYYSAFLQKGVLSRQGVDFGIHDADKTGFMTVIHNLDKTKGLDLILHTPGGNVSATESIVYYLKSIFGNDIRAIVPQIAMSAGTMISCACKEIIMGKHSNLGPIDPQFGNLPAHGIIEEFENAKKEISSDPRQIVIWREILSKYNPTLIGECQKAIKWANTMVSQWLKDNMFCGDPDADSKISAIISELGSHATTLSHSRHIHVDALRALGLKIVDMETDNELQDRILSVHHSAIISLTQTKSIKIIENQEGKAFMQSV
ncbi:SDH family Clp fold serine proteinase [Bacteroides mediterraneensis]|uniref:ATP-dependent Clp protease proteolytic subunit n=1 Tax=Bacteroides mediterraneensis TaxID=1841856 RepID=A0ABS2EYR4_9BACE|nr:ATP-dependent Clp protease proteolytic subunit [Bacteroides mediterraneensis]MBM6759835.1 ATP-dependent Clp protease proteolytic subunit [Bacteroides mediterraneensis]